MTINIATINEIEEIYSFYCDCGEQHTIPVPAKEKATIRVKECDKGVRLSWRDGEFHIIDYAVERERQRKARKAKGVPLVHRLSFGGDLFSNFYWSMWGAPLRLWTRLAVKLWRWKIKHGGYRLIREWSNEVPYRFVPYRPRDEKEKSGATAKGSLDVNDWS